MRKTLLHNNSTIRFRRWSRVGYAVFCSLASTVSIGTLAVSVSDKTLDKSVGSNASNAIYSSTSDTNDLENSDDKLELETTLQQFEAISFVKTSIDSAAACGQNTYIIIHRNG